MQKKLAKLQLRLELDGDLTRFQPPQVPVVNNQDGTVRCLLLTSAELFYKHQAIVASGCFGADCAPLPCDVLRGKDFRISERYRCVADRKGQAQGGVGFIFEGLDMVNGTKVQLSRLPCIFFVVGVTSLEGNQKVTCHVFVGEQSGVKLSHSPMQTSTCRQKRHIYLFVMTVPPFSRSSSYVRR